MNLKVSGTITRFLEIESGTSKAGKPWQKSGFILNTADQYNPEICFSVFGEDKVAMLNSLSLGEMVEVSFNISSREFNGKYYHNVDAWKIDSIEPANSAPAPTQDDPEDDLPF